jgi:hypothetical protein
MQARRGPSGGPGAITSRGSFATRWETVSVLVEEAAAKGLQRRAKCTSRRKEGVHRWTKAVFLGVVPPTRRRVVDRIAGAKGGWPAMLLVSVEVCLSAPGWLVAVIDLVRSLGYGRGHLLSMRCVRWCCRRSSLPAPFPSIQFSFFLDFMFVFDR